jgi:uncharacterized protein
MSDTSAMQVGPIGERERISEIDVLRGVALLGVLLMNFIAFAGQHIMSTEEQVRALSTARADWWAYFLALWLIGDKANTIFATLFGLGFYLQMSRSEGKPGFEARYCRRLTWLLVFGWINMIFIWVWDILNLFALAGFCLLLMRKWSARRLAIFGLIVSLYSDNLQESITGLFGVRLVPDGLYDTPAVAARQAVALHGTYPELVAKMWSWTWSEWLGGGLLIAWGVYALGRFALGAAIGKSGLLNDIKGHLPMFRRIAKIGIPLGLVLALVARLLALKLWQPIGDADWLAQVGEAIRSPAALVLAAGYASGVIVALHAGWGRKVFGPCAAVGRMALTNYLLQGAMIGFVLFGVGPGLGLAGQIGTTTVILICLAFYAFQILFSHWWLSRFRFGPMEWLWRTLTYGKRPAFKRESSGDPVVA